MEIFYTIKTEISKQTIMNKISELNINIEETKPEVKKVVDNIYCIADEDHVHFQKGGIEEPRLIVVYDSIMKDGKRTKLCNKKHFGGVYKGKIDDLWEEVLTYIDNTYDLEKVKNIYILGDGANWIKTGLEWILESINFKPIEIPIMKFGTTEQRKFFEQLISYKNAA